MIYVTVADYCSESGKNERTVRRMCSAGIIVAKKSGAKWMVGLDVVQKFSDDEDDCYECEEYQDCDGVDCACDDDAPVVELPTPEECALPDLEVIEVKVPVKIPVKLLLSVISVKDG